MALRSQTSRMRNGRKRFANQILNRPETDHFPGIHFVIKYSNCSDPYGHRFCLRSPGNPHCELHHSYTFWTMPFLIFGLVQIIMRYLYVLLIFGTFHSFLADLGRNWGQQHINKFILVKQTRQQALTVLIYIYVGVCLSNTECINKNGKVSRYY